MSTNTMTNISSAANPQDGAFQLVSQFPGQVKKSRTPRSRKPRRQRGKVEQLALPGLPPDPSKREE